VVGALIGNLVLTCGKTNELWIFEYGFRLSAAEFMSVLPEVAILKQIRNKADILNCKETEFFFG
jgi:hypothetical protein